MRIIYTIGGVGADSATERRFSDSGGLPEMKPSGFGDLNHDFNESLVEARRPKPPYFFDVDALTKFNLKCLESYLAGWITPRISKKKKLKKRRSAPK